MRKILFVILIVIPIYGFSQINMYECLCDNGHKMIFEINLKKQEIRLTSWFNPDTGKLIPVKNPYYKNVLWKKDLIFFIEKENNGDISTKRFNLIENKFFNGHFVQNQIGRENYTNQWERVYTCFWRRP